MAVKVGKPAPDFETNAWINGAIKKVTLSNYRGTGAMLSFFPGDFTFIWPAELTAVAAKHGEIKSLGAGIPAISIDSPLTHRVWQEGELSKIVPGELPAAPGPNGL